MNLRLLVKRVIFGLPGTHPRVVRRGLLRGLSFHIDPATKSQRLLGLDEAEIAPEVRRLATIARFALDIGANDGWYSLYFASRPNIERVLAFEPEPTLLEKLRANFALNDPSFAAKLNCYQKLAGDANDATWCSVDRAVGNLPRPVLLKIDVDGGERDVLRGARQLLASLQAILVIETHSRELEEGYLALLAGHGYHATVVRNGWYRHLLPETRQLTHNRWLVARPGPQ